MRKYIFVVCSLVLVLAASYRISSAISLSSAQGCDANAVIRCGITSAADAPAQFQAAGVSDIYGFFGISAADINNLAAQAVAGRVTSDGRVIVGNKVVATNAVTAGRQNMSGSTAVSRGGTTFFTRPPSVSFASSSLAAFVVMDANGRFAFAIIASCGNPVMATPVPLAKVVKPTTRSVVTPTHTTVVVTPAPAQTQTQSQVQSQTIINTPAPVPTPVVATVTQPATVAAAPAAATTTLPNTGPGNVLGLGAITSVFGTIGHYWYVRRKLS